MLIFADVTFSTEGIVVISGLLVALSGALVFMFKLYQRVMDERAAVLENRCKSYESIGIEAVRALEMKVRRDMIKDGKTPLAPVVAVVGEHNSEMTPNQRATADLATLRARVTAAKLAAGLPARTAEGNGDDENAISPEQLPEATGRVAVALDELATKVEELPNKTADEIEKRKEETP